MAKKKRLILRVGESKNNQLRVTIPPNKGIVGDDYVEVKKLGDKS